MLTFANLTKTYAGGGAAALSQVDLAVQAGEIAAIVGGSGCGKTTLLRLTAGLDQASSGFIEIDGDRVTAPHPAIGIVFQEPRLLPWLTVRDNVAFGLGDQPRAARRQRADEALERVGLAGYGDRWPRELSGGQQQRVAIARALAPRPKALLLDEPFSALDAFTRASLHDHLLALWEESRPTVVSVTHDVEEAVTLGDRIIVMQPRPGRIYEEIPVDLPRPRDRMSPNFDAAKRRVLKALDNSLNPQHPPGQTAPAGGALWW